MKKLGGKYSLFICKIHRLPYLIPKPLLLDLIRSCSRRDEGYDPIGLSLRVALSSWLPKKCSRNSRKVKLPAHRRASRARSDEQNASKGSYVHIVPPDPPISLLAVRGTFRSRIVGLLPKWISCFDKLSTNRKSYDFNPAPFALSLVKGNGRFEQQPLKIRHQG